MNKNLTAYEKIIHTINEEYKVFSKKMEKRSGLSRWDMKKKVYIQSCFLCF